VLLVCPGPQAQPAPLARLVLPVQLEQLVLLVRLACLV